MLYKYQGNFVISSKRLIKQSLNLITLYLKKEKKIKMLAWMTEFPHSNNEKEKKMTEKPYQWALCIKHFQLLKLSTYLLIFFFSF